MKLFTLFLFFNLIISSLPAQDKPAYYKDLVIQVPGIVKERGYPEIKSALIQINGVEVYTFCRSQYLILLKLNKNLVTDEKIIFSRIRELGFNFYVKENASIAKALSACSHEEIPPSDYQIMDNE